MRKIFFSFLFLIVFISLISLSSAENIATCRNINQSGTYVLTQNINATETCFIITGNNVNLNGNGYSITGNSSYITYFGVNVTNRVNVTINNFSGINRFGLSGIYFYNTTNSTISNNSLFFDGTVNQYQGGIDIVNSSDNVITGNNASYNWVYGITLEVSSKRNNLTYNNVNNNQYSGIALQDNAKSNNIYYNNISSHLAAGIEFTLSSNSNTVIYNNIYNTSDGGGIYIGAAISNVLGLNVINLGKYGVWIEGGIGNILYNNYITNITIAPSYDVYSSSSAILNYFVNMTYNISKENVDGTSQLFRYWYANINITNSTGALDNVNVSAYNSTNNLQFSHLTNSAGSISTQLLGEYTNNQGTRSFYTPYNITATKTGYTSESVSLNLTNSTSLILIMQVSSDPISNSSTTTFCNTFLPSLGGFWGQFIAIFGVVALLMVIGAIFLLKATVDNNSNSENILENVDFRLVFASILVIAIVLFVIVMTFGALCAVT